MARSNNGFIFLIYVSVVILFTNCESKLKEAPIMLFNGEGVSVNDVEAFQHLLSTNHLDFTLINSAQLNTINKNQLAKYKLLIVPGGNFIDMSESLSPATTAKVRHAVHQGLNYLGVCAGGFLAGDTHHNSFNISNGAQFKFYAAEEKGVRKAVVPVTNADGTIIEHYWEDGPQLNGWGEIVSKYPDSTAATVQNNYGAGWVVLTGVHPEAPESWRKGFVVSTPIESSHRYAVALIRSALNRTAMSSFK